MNKKIISKLSLLLVGIASRLKENEDFLVAIEALFKSGLKTYRGIGELKDGLVLWNYKGITKEKSPLEVLEEVKEEAINYDSLVLRIIERGNILELNCDEKDVRVKNIDESFVRFSNKALKSNGKGGNIKGRDNNSSPHYFDKDELNHLGESSTLLNRSYLINHEVAAPLLKELGILTSEGKIKNDKIRKYNQIDRYVELLDKDLDRFKGQRIHIVDCGCGKSYLSFVLNHYLTEVKKIKCTITGIDISPKVIEASRKMAENLGYRNMNFLVGDIKNLILKDHPNIVISLHACDTATDLALNFALKNESELIVAVPCCHAEMNRKYSHSDFNSILKHGILKRRMADLLTDGLRALILEGQGYNVTIEEYISPLESPKNLMIKASKKAGKNEKIEDEIMRLISKLDYAPALFRLINNLED